MNEAAQAAKIIRKELKSNGVKARVTSKSYSMGSSIYVCLANPLPATMEKVKAFSKGFQYGHFDGMTDMYENSNYKEYLPQAKFVFVEAVYDDEIKQAAKDYVADKYEIKRYSSFELMQLESKVLSGDEGEFWTARKPQLKIKGVI